MKGNCERRMRHHGAALARPAAAVTGFISVFISATLTQQEAKLSLATV